MSPIDKITKEALALPTDLKLQLLKQLVTSLNQDKAQANATQGLDFWEKLETLKQKMKEEAIEINPQEIWGDVRDKEVGKEITLP